MENRVPGAECDVLVVGWGNAGSVAAITAHDNGAEVLIIEKMRNGGGNCAVSGGSICSAKSADFADYLEAISFKTVDRKLIDIFVQGAMKIPDFIRSLGGQPVPNIPLEGTRPYPTPVPGPSFPSVPKGDRITKWKIAEGTEGGDKHTGTRLWNLWKRNVESRGIRVMTGTSARELVKNERGEVVGMVAERGGETFFIRARKAVIMTTGGYDNDKDTLWEYYIPKPMKYLGSPGNTGDGVRILQKAGAALWHMTNITGTAAFQPPDLGAAFMIYCFEKDFIYVNKYGKRFMDEATWECHQYAAFVDYFDTVRMEFPAIPAYLVFGERTRKAGGLCPNAEAFNMNLYEWSLDNSAEIARGWITRAESIDQLAKKIGVDPAALQGTVGKYNLACRAGKDSEFSRPKEDMAPIEGDVFYALPLYPASFGTKGGGRRDKQSRVLDLAGKPIPRLYEAGDLGGILGWLYQGSSGLAEGIVFGQIAGKNAAAEKSL